MGNVFKESFVKYLSSAYPNLSASPEDLQKISRIVSDRKIILRKEILNKAVTFVKSAFKLRTQTEYKKHLASVANETQRFEPANFSVLMGYDFHLVGENDLKLIEVNTNASSSLLAEALYRKSGNTKIADQFVTSLRQSFENEIKYFDKTVKNIAIIDENPLQQNAYVEFLLFQIKFREWGYEAIIGDPSEFTLKDGKLFHGDKRIHFVYNRLTDFYFEMPNNSHLHQAYLENSCAFSPTPYEYFALADKQRLVDWTNFDLRKFGLNAEEALAIQNTLPKTIPFTSFPDLATLWSERKKYFFKPRNSYAGKGAFRGDNISRKLFGELTPEKFLAQEYIAPPTIEAFDENGKSAPLKWDLRFYVYRDEIQGAVARVYRGQATNFQNEGSGLAIVLFDAN